MIVTFVDIYVCEVFMKYERNGKSVIELNTTEQKVIKNDILEEIFEEDMDRRVNWILRHKYERCFERLKKEWVDDKDENGQCKLEKNGVQSIPTNRDALAELIFNQPNYKDRSKREKL